MPTITEYGYGFFCGGDPRRFSPDSDSREEELENHRLACEAWDRGERKSRADCQHSEGVIVTSCQFGLGSYDYDIELTWFEYAQYVYYERILEPLRRWWEYDMKPAMAEAWSGEYKAWCWKCFCWRVAGTACQGEKCREVA